MKKLRTPSQIAKQRPEKKIVSFSLLKQNIERINQIAEAENVPASELVDAAIEYYLEAIKDDTSNRPKE